MVALLFSVQEKNIFQAIIFIRDLLCQPKDFDTSKSLGSSSQILQLSSK